MSLRRELVQIIDQTSTAIAQQTENDIDVVFLSEALEEALVLPVVNTVPGEATDSLPALHDSYCQCTACPLGHRRNHFVFGSGNESADLMLIGEAPGAEEDSKGLPFVGAAGQLLTKILQSVHFKREDVYIANILKCRPPKNRNPEPYEVEACEPILREQIRLVRPKLICALGRVAAQVLLNTTCPLGQLRGQFHEYAGTKLLVTYHPSALLRNPSFKRPTWEDVQLLREEYDRLTGSA
ncbi:MAG: uracil-DNA glycosylase [Gemmatimonadota bacterium]|nr:uracil-DNA glycosylase [Gemmatimonadota bacterium]